MEIKRLELFGFKELVGVDLEFDGQFNKNRYKLKDKKKHNIAAMYENKQDREMLYLYRLLDALIIKQLQDCKTSSMVFARLDSIYSKQEGVELVLLMYKLSNLRMRDVNGVDKYISDFKGLQNDLEKREHKIVEVKRVLFLLCGIVEEWRHLRAQIFLQYGYDKLTTDNVKNALREYSAADRFGKEKEKNRGGGEHALYGEKRRSSEDVVYSKCGRRGHKKDKCVTKCYNCSKIEHVASKCTNERERDCLLNRQPWCTFSTQNILNEHWLWDLATLLLSYARQIYLSEGDISCVDASFSLVSTNTFMDSMWI